MNFPTLIDVMSDKQAHRTSIHTKCSGELRKWADRRRNSLRRPLCSKGQARGSSSSVTVSQPLTCASLTVKANFSFSGSGEASVNNDLRRWAACCEIETTGMAIERCWMFPDSSSATSCKSYTHHAHTHTETTTTIICEKSIIVIMT